jgi:hypothetical protein
MDILQKIVGQIFPPYKRKVQRRERCLLLDALIFALPDDYRDLKEQRQKTQFFFFSDWVLFPGFRFLNIGYPGTTLNDFKKRGNHFKLSGLQIFSKKLDNFTDVEFIIHDNYLAGLKIERSNYEMDEFDLDRIQCTRLERTSVEFPPSEIDLFYERLDDKIKTKLNPDDLFDIDFNNRTYCAFYDMEDGNYLATDKNLNVYSLVHDARPAVKKLKYSLEDILNEIASNRFNKDGHLDQRYERGA